MNPRRALAFLLAMMLAFALGTTTAMAQQADVPLPDTSNAPEPLKPEAGFSGDLNAAVAANVARLTAWRQRGVALTAQAQSLGSRIAAHNARGDAYPNRQAPPAVAGPYNAEAAALNAEQQSLRGQLSAWQAEGEQLQAERQQLLQRMAAARQAQQNARAGIPGSAPPAAQSLGGDRATSASRTPPKESSNNGGDPASRSKQADALAQYAKDKGVPVDQRPVTTSLTPETLPKLPAKESAKLPLDRTFDGLVRKPDGSYKGLYVTTPESPKRSSGETAFDQAIQRGAQASAVVDGRRITITEVERIKTAPGRAPPDFKYRGGLYQDLGRVNPAKPTAKLVNPGTERNHIPPKSVTGISKMGDGPAIEMDKLDHRETASWGPSKAAIDYRAKQLDLIKNGRCREAVQMDLDDIHAKFGTKYDAAIAEMMKSLPPECR
ncbi:hypothetical protein SAMN05421504_101408 [Amycolatopsis xylanica]|uniref:Uncharacterized protein n=1 Tax=Amycolatopsis xylanica TaxID=589385 RepID=A0A1H2T1F1_9PSEU|nr:hypothetical protein [Amycolatopsis xylanica]SDW37084.1 hypothetical protein SAMN05421504_101408 [Amycolatopsis xylanica]